MSLWGPIVWNGGSEYMCWPWAPHLIFIAHSLSFFHPSIPSLPLCPLCRCQLVNVSENLSSLSSEWPTIKMMSELGSFEAIPFHPPRWWCPSIRGNAVVSETESWGYHRKRKRDVPLTTPKWRYWHKKCVFLLLMTEDFLMFQVELSIKKHCAFTYSNEIKRSKLVNFILNWLNISKAVHVKAKIPRTQY